MFTQFINTVNHSLITVHQFSTSFQAYTARTARPSLSLQIPLTSAPCSTRIFTTSAWPPHDALKRGCHYRIIMDQHFHMFYQHGSPLYCHHYSHHFILFPSYPNHTSLPSMSLYTLLISAPCSTRSWTMSLWPSLDAMRRGVSYRIITEQQFHTAYHY